MHRFMAFLEQSHKRIFEYPPLFRPKMRTISKYYVITTPEKPELDTKNGNGGSKNRKMTHYDLHNFSQLFSVF